MKAKKTSAQLADGRELIYCDEHPSADRQIQDTRDLGRTTVRSEIRYDPLLGEWVVLASHRQDRTHPPPAELYPLCPSTTTHKTEIPAADYDVVVFENRFPSLVTDAGTVDEGDELVPRRPGIGRCEGADPVHHRPALRHRGGLPQRPQGVGVGRDRVARLLLALALAVAGCGTGGGGGGAGPAGSPATTAAGPRQFTNPVLAGNFADPAVLKVGDTWYAYATGDLVANLQVARSTDLVRWERLDDALPELPEWSVLQKGLTWAPEVARAPAGFVLYYTLRHAASGRQCISVAVAERPQGPFRDTRARPLVCQERLGGSIDPHRFVDRDGTAYLLWKNDGNCCDKPTQLWAQRLDGDGLELTGKPSSLGVRNDAAWEGDLIEAPTLWRDGDTYYLFYSANDYGSPSYAVGYASASRVLGPYRDGPGNPILRSRGSAAGPGGQAVVTDGHGDLWLAYHAWDSAAVGDEAGGQRSMWLDRLSFEGGRPRVAGPTDGPQEAP